MKKFLLTIIILFSSIITVDATSISNIDMNIFLDEYGTAYIEEIWSAEVYEGTEGWHPYYNLGNSTISNVSVTMDNIEYTTINNWNINASLEEKAYKAGIYKVDSNEIDIVFGISRYGKHTYKIKYQITNFVSTIEDADIVYWNLFPQNFSAEPQNVNIKIYSNFKYQDTLDVWGYGKYGAPCYVYNGIIEMTSDGVLKSNEYLTILVKFPKGTFKTNDMLPKDFAYYHKLAEKGAKNYINNFDNIIYNPCFLTVALVIITILMTKIFSLIILIINSFINRIISLFEKSSFNELNIKFKDGNNIDKDIPYFRELPAEKDIFLGYWIAGTYNLIRKKEDFLGSIILKWIKEKKVTIEKSTKKGLFKTKEIINIKLKHNCLVKHDNKYEQELYEYMCEASKDKVLESKEFEKWCKKHWYRIFRWFTKIIEYEINELIKKGKIPKEIKERRGLFSRTLYSEYTVDSSIKLEAEKLAGLKKYLNHFTTIETKEPIEVNLWNDYLIYAQIFGIADKVSKKLEELYPELINDVNNSIYNYYDISFVNSIMKNGVKSAYSEKRHVEYLSNINSGMNSYSSTGSGGGGRSSSGGGSSSRGSGSGGGGFR